jgi:hypothetical protein
VQVCPCLQSCFPLVTLRCFPSLAPETDLEGGLQSTSLTTLSRILRDVADVDDLTSFSQEDALREGKDPLEDPRPPPAIMLEEIADKFAAAAAFEKVSAQLPHSCLKAGNGREMVETLGGGDALASTSQPPLALAATPPPGASLCSGTSLKSLSLLGS